MPRELLDAFRPRRVAAALDETTASPTSTATFNRDEPSELQRMDRDSDSDQNLWRFYLYFSFIRLNVRTAPSHHPSPVPHPIIFCLQVAAVSLPSQLSSSPYLSSCEAISGDGDALEARGADTWNCRKPPWICRLQLMRTRCGAAGRDFSHLLAGYPSHGMREWQIRWFFACAKLPVRIHHVDVQ